MDLALNDSIKFLITMLSIINPLGIIPIFLSLTHKFSNKQIHSIAKSCSLTVMITLGVGLSIGKYILNFFGIGIGAFSIAGGILIFTMAFNMIQAKTNPSKINEDEQLDIEDDQTELGIVPLAIPLLSGPGAISTSIISSSKFSTIYHWVFTAIAILIIGLIVWLILSSGRKIGDKLGTLGLNVMTRIMGLILLALSIEVIINGLKTMFPKFF